MRQSKSRRPTIVIARNVFPDQKNHLVNIGWCAEIDIEFLIATFAIEILYGFIDPRIKASQSD